MSSAKEIGLAMLMYCQDYDEKFPPAGDIASTIKDYLMSRDAFNNPATGQPAFTYLLNGDELAGIKSPATTAMGYLGGPGGRAVLYSDGHVQWEPTPQ
jgi:hypothetical protein